MKSAYFLLLFLLMQLSIAGQDIIKAGFESGIGDYATYTGTIDTCGRLVIENCGSVEINTLEFAPEQFTIVDINGIDTIARDSCKDNNLFKLVPDGGGLHALRLGNAAAGGKAEKIVLKFTVTPELSFFLLNYAVFLNDPSHHSNHQPRFEMNILDERGNPVDCGQYKVRAKEMIEGFENCKGNWKVRPWTAVGFELQRFLGETIQIVILTTDCAQGAHAGYAYIDANFSPLEIVLEGYCPDSTNAQIRVTEGFIDYQWSTDNPADTSNILELVNPEPESIYFVTVTSGTGCTLVLSDTIPPLQEFPIPEFDLFTNTTICEGDSIIFKPTGINLKEIISLDSLDFNDSDTSFVLDPTETKEYLFVAFGRHRCITDTLSLLVEVKKLPQSFFTTSDSTYCSGDTISLDYRSTGEGNHPIWILGDSTIYRGTKPPPQVYANDTGAPFKVNLTLIDSTACAVDTFSKRIIILNAPQSGINMPPTACVDEQVTIEASEGTAIKHQWSSSNGKVSYEKAIEVAYQEDGIDTIYLLVTDESACTNTYSQKLTIHPLPEPYFEEVLTNTCPPTTVSLKNISPFTSNNIYEWYKEEERISTDTIPPMTIVDQGGSFQIKLIAMNELDCSNTFSKHLFIPSNPKAIIRNSENTGCINTDIRLESASGESPLTYQWGLSNGMFFFNQNPIFQVEESGTITATLIVSNGDCLDTTATTIEISRPSQLNVAIEQEDQIIDLGKQLELLVDFNAASPTIEWYPTEGLSCSDCAATFARPLKSTLYTVYVTEENGCVDSAFIKIGINKKAKAYVPNVFSPNDDGRNDRFFPLGDRTNIQQILQFGIYDRWGELLFERLDFPISASESEFEFGWDGRFNGQQAPPGVYIYHLVFRLVDGTIKRKKGDLTLVR